MKRQQPMGAKDERLEASKLEIRDTVSSAAIRCIQIDAGEMPPYKKTVQVVGFVFPNLPTYHDDEGEGLQAIGLLAEMRRAWLEKNDIKARR